MKIDPIESWEEDGARFIRERITQLRLNHNLSEYALSYELGNNRNYIGTISRRIMLYRNGSSFSKYAMCFISHQLNFLIRKVIHIN